MRNLVPQGMTRNYVNAPPMSLIKRRIDYDFSFPSALPLGISPPARALPVVGKSVSDPQKPGRKILRATRSTTTSGGRVTRSSTLSSI